MKVLVTGGSGLLATHIIEQLQQSGYTVRCTVRNKDKLRAASKSDIEIYEGDILDPEFVTCACEGCDYVIHAAAQTPDKHVAKKIFYEVNVTGTANVLRASVKQQIRKFIFVSTANTIGYGTKGNPGNETFAMKWPFTKNIYAQAKLKAEELVLLYKEKMEVVIVNPTFLLGPYINHTGSGQILFRAFDKKLVLYPSTGRKNIIHVQDAAIAIVKSITHARSGEKYLLCSDSVTYKQIYETAANVHSQFAQIFIPVPSFLLMLAGTFGSAFLSVGIKNNIQFYNVMSLLTVSHYTNEKAVRELGISFRSAKDTILDSTRWIVNAQ